MEATIAALVFLPVALIYAVFLILALRADNDRKDAEIKRLKALIAPWDRDGDGKPGGGLKINATHPAVVKANRDYDEWLSEENKKALKAIADPPHYSYTEAALLRAKR